MDAGVYSSHRDDSARRRSEMPATKTKSPGKKATPVTKKPAAGGRSKAPGARMSLADAMGALERAGSAQTRKTYTRHGAQEPMFGVSFAVLSGLVKRIRVDHELAQQLWETGNHDARMLAVKIADPARVSPAELDRWASGMNTRMCGGYVAMLAAESPHSHAKVRQWLASKDEAERCAGWSALSQLAQRDAAAPDAMFADALQRIEKSIHESGNREREMMNGAVIAIGCRSVALRKAAMSAAKRIGKVVVDHGDTACRTPDAAQYIEKTWGYATSKGFESPAAQERARETPRTRC
jgi:3-methyladenine DNA glycosylase AlkD